MLRFVLPLVLVLSRLLRLAGGGYHAVFTEVSEGRLRGVMGRSTGGRMFFAYKGVPYARPPVGPLRWKAPQPPQPWQGVREATVDAPACPQFVILTEVYIGREDCLYLNVFAPPGATNAPIIVWFHGGAFIAGSGRHDQYGPELFMDLDVIVVSVSYRLGALGFLSTGDSLIPGNYGLKDQVAALRWLQRNAGAFGGDAARVTLLGQSAGAACASLLLLSPLARGLFSGAIVVSGSALAAWAVDRHPAGVFDKVAGFVGCGKDDGEEEVHEVCEEEEESDGVENATQGVGSEYTERRSVEDGEGASSIAEAEEATKPPELLPMSRSQKVNCLRNVPADELVRIVYKFPWWGLKIPVPFKAVIEKQGCAEEEAPFLTGDPEQLLRAGRLNAVPLLTGVTSAEGLCLALATYVNPSLRRELRWRFRRVLNQHILSGRWSQADLTKLRHYYLGGAAGPLGRGGGDGPAPELRLSSLTRLFSDASIIAWQTRFARLWAHVARRRVFFYVFDFEGRAAQVMRVGLYPGPYGVDHGDDLPYLFEDRSRPFPGGRDRRERVAARLWTSMMVNFAATGHPTPLQRARAPVFWRPLGPNCSFRYLRFDDAPTMVEGLPFSEAMEFWDFVEENAQRDSGGAGEEETEDDGDEREEAAELAAEEAAVKALRKAQDAARERAELQREPALRRAEAVAKAARRAERKRADLERRRAELRSLRSRATVLLRKRRAQLAERAATRGAREAEREERRRTLELGRRQGDGRQQPHARGSFAAVEEPPAPPQVSRDQQQVADEAWEKAVQDALKTAKEEQCMELQEAQLSKEEVQQLQQEVESEDAALEEMMAAQRATDAEAEAQAKADLEAEMAAQYAAAEAAALAKRLELQDQAEAEAYAHEEQETATATEPPEPQRRRGRAKRVREREREKSAIEAMVEVIVEGSIKESFDDQEELAQEDFYDDWDTFDGVQVRTTKDSSKRVQIPTKHADDSPSDEEEEADQTTPADETQPKPKVPAGLQLETTTPAATSNAEQKSPKSEGAPSADGQLGGAFVADLVMEGDGARIKANFTLDVDGDKAAKMQKSASIFSEEEEKDKKTKNERSK